MAHSFSTGPLDADAQAQAPARPAGGEEQRKTPRKNLRRPATVVMDGAVRLGAKTQDISIGGVCLLLPRHIARGQLCSVEFVIPLRGQHLGVRTTGKGAYSVCVGVEGFRVGLEFVDIDERSLAAIRAYMNAAIFP